MTVPERPKLGCTLHYGRLSPTSDHYFLANRLRPGTSPEVFNALEFTCLAFFDGRRTFREIQVSAMEHCGGQFIPLAMIRALAVRLNDAELLDDLTLYAGPVRPPACIGCYPAEPREVQQLLDKLFAEGAGKPGEPKPDDSLRAALVPHIDYARGGLTYTYAFKEVYEHTPASLFVIIGTSHYSPERFTLTRKHFQTPLGVVETDQEYVDKLVAHYGDGLFDDELGAHIPEHSIELEVVFLQYLYAGKRPLRIVPLLVGSFRDCVEAGGSPRDKQDIGRMVEALRAVERQTKEPICYLISGDLAHIGPAFDDPDRIDDETLRHSLHRDQAIVEHAESGDADDYFNVIAEEEDRRRICGLPPTWLTLDVLRPSRGRNLDYRQYVQHDRNLSVSFASMAFYQ